MLLVCSNLAILSLLIDCKDVVMSVLDKILDTAERLFNGRGYNAVGIDLIRDEAEVSKTTIYRHFSSKTELIIKVLRRRHGRLQASLGEAIQGADSSNQKLQCFLDWHFNMYKQDYFEGCMFMHALSEFKKQEKGIYKVALEHKQWLLQTIKQILTSDEKINKDLIGDKAELLLTYVEGLTVRAEFNALTLPREVYMKEALKIAA